MHTYTKPNGVRMIRIGPHSYVNEIAAVRLGLIHLPRP